MTLQRLAPLAGMCLILLVALLLSVDRRAIRIRVVGAALALQAAAAVLVLRVPLGVAAIAAASAWVADLLGYAARGTAFVFGPLARPDTGGASFAISALPSIIFFAALISVLYHVGIMPLAIRWIGGALERLTGISRVEALCAAANIFVGQSESPLVIRRYLAGLAPSRLFQVMTSGMAGVAGTILGAYAAMGIDIRYLLAASLMSAPGAILMAKIIMPDPPDLVLALGEPAIEPLPVGERSANLIQAAAEGAQTGVKLAVAVGAMVLAFIGLVALANGLLAAIGGWFGVAGLSFEALLGWVFAPVMWLLGLPWREAWVGGALFGEKVILNEFVAFGHLGKATGLDPRSVAVITFSLCGFANFASIAIQMAVTGSLAPDQRATIARLGPRALAAGSLANLMSAAMAALLMP